LGGDGYYTTFQKKWNEHQVEKWDNPTDETGTVDENPTGIGYLK
jgi:hypothetical protein